MAASGAKTRSGYQDINDAANGIEQRGNGSFEEVPDTFTVDEAVDVAGFGAFQLRLSTLVGLGWTSESMEVMLLSVLSPAIHCSWRVSSWQQALLTSAVFTGMAAGAAFWGVFSDKYGRRSTLMTSGSFLAYFGVVSSFSPTYGWLLFLRGLVGFFVGAVAQVVTLYAELLPSKHRGNCVVFIALFWTLGGVLEVLLAAVVMPTLGWRWLLAFSSVPLLLFAALSPLLPESPRYHGASGQPQKAENTLRHMAAANGRQALPGTLHMEATEASQRGSLRDLLSPQLRLTTLLLWWIWMAVTFCYYGIVLVATEVFRLPDNDLCGGVEEAPEQQVCQAYCKMLDTADYLDILLTTLAEAPGLLLALAVIDKLGRKKTTACGLLLFSIGPLALMACIQSRSFLTAALFISRAMVAGVYQAIFLYTPEVYPTHLRAIGMGSCSSISRLGAMVTPAVAQVLVHSSVQYTAVVYAGVAALCIVATLLLPTETSGRAIQ